MVLSLKICKKKIKNMKHLKLVNIMSQKSKIKVSILNIYTWKNNCLMDSNACLIILCNSIKFNSIKKKMHSLIKWFKQQIQLDLKKRLYIKVIWFFKYLMYFYNNIILSWKRKEFSTKKFSMDLKFNILILEKIKIYIL